MALYVSGALNCLLQLFVWSNHRHNALKRSALRMLALFELSIFGDNETEMYAS